jgi:hypothetical protein
MTRIECPYCGAFATKIPGPTVPFHKWEEAVIAVRKAGFWQVHINAKIKLLEEELDIRREMVRWWETDSTDQGEYEGLVIAIAHLQKRAGT